MRCLNPRTVSQVANGAPINWSKKKYTKSDKVFQLPCSKCIECRLEYARQWAIRCVHEAKMHKKNSFVTLTYSDENLKSKKLQYRDFELFMKKLRKTQNEPIGMFVTGEYGDKTKRPHWHAILFNWSPNDLTYKYTSDRGDTVYKSALLTKLWANGNAEIGSVTFESAGYCARYAAKKLVHGKDSEHDYNPISKKSSKNAIGKKFLESYWPDIFSYGYVILDGGQKCAIPRYYEKWLEKNQPAAYHTYVTQIKNKKIELANSRSEEERLNMINLYADRAAEGKGLLASPIDKSEVRRIIIDEKFKQLQKHLKGDI